MTSFSLLGLLVLAKIIITMLCVLLGVAYMTLLERKVLSYLQIRKGPNKVGLMGLLQPIADAMKLLLKELVLPTNSNMYIYFLLPVGGLAISLALWHIMPSWYAMHYVIMSLLLFVCISSMNVYIVMGCGWASNSTYAFLGGMRASAQTISYEISLIFILLVPLLFTPTVCTVDLLNNYPMLILFFPLFVMWVTTCLAETNRAPFDFAEGESELVSGFNVEYGGGFFALLFLAEYTSIMLLSALTCLCFMPTLSMSLYVIGSIIMIMFFLFIRGIYPRHRYDFLMMMCWKSLLPISLGFLSLIGLILLM